MRDISVISSELPHRIRESVMIRGRRLARVQNGVLVVQSKALPLDLLGETRENEGGLMAGSIAVMWIRDGGHLAANSVTALNLMWLFVKS